MLSEIILSSVYLEFSFNETPYQQGPCGSSDSVFGSNLFSVLHTPQGLMCGNVSVCEYRWVMCMCGCVGVCLQYNAQGERCETFLTMLGGWLLWDLNLPLNSQ